MIMTVNSTTLVRGVGRGIHGQPECAPLYAPISLYPARGGPAYKRPPQCSSLSRRACKGGFDSMPLKITVRSVLPAREVGDITVVGTPLIGGRSKKNERTTLDGFDRALGGALGRLIKKEEFKGKKDQQISLSTLGRVKSERLVVIGLGDVAKLGPGDVRTFAAKAARAANGDKAKRLVLGVPEGLEDRLREIVEGLELGAYRFTRYLTGDRKPKTELGQVTICLLGTVPKNAKERVELGQT